MERRVQLKVRVRRNPSAVDDSARKKIQATSILYSFLFILFLLVPLLSLSLFFRQWPIFLRVWRSGGRGRGEIMRDARDVITYFTTINCRARRKTETRREKTSLYFVRNNFWRQLLRSQRRASYPGVSAYPNINGLGIVLFTTPVSHNSRRGEIWMHLEDGWAIDRRTNPRRTVKTGSFLSNENCNPKSVFLLFYLSFSSRYSWEQLNRFSLIILFSYFFL